MITLYVVKCQQLFPEGDPLPFKFPDGHSAIFQMRDDAEKLALALMAQPKNRGFRFLVEQQATASPGDLEAAEAREYLV